MNLYPYVITLLFFIMIYHSTSRFLDCYIFTIIGSILIHIIDCIVLYQYTPKFYFVLFLCFCLLNLSISISLFQYILQTFVSVICVIAILSLYCHVIMLEYSEISTSISCCTEVYIPYNTSEHALAFGMGAAEQVAYDHVQKRLAADCLVRLWCFNRGIRRNINYTVYVYMCMCIYIYMCIGMHILSFRISKCLFVIHVSYSHFLPAQVCLRRVGARRAERHRLGQRHQSPGALAFL